MKLDTAIHGILPQKRLALYSTGDHTTPTIGQVRIEKGYGGDDTTLSLYINNQCLSDQLDYEQRLDTYCHQSDDGERDYVLLHLLDTHTPQSPPDYTTALQSATPYLNKLMQEMIAGNMYGSDVAWAGRILTHPVWLYKTWLDHNKDIDAAQYFLCKTIFGYTP